MTAQSALRVDVAELRRRLGERRAIRDEIMLDALEVAGVGLDPAVAVSVDLTLESVAGGIEVTGYVRGGWVGPCRRCLEPVTGRLDVAVRELFEDAPTEGDTYPIVAESIELMPLVRDALAGGLPLAPVCREDCPGPDPDEYPLASQHDDTPDGDALAPKDPRWAALDVLLEPDADSESGERRD